VIAVGDSEAQESALETCKISPSQTKQWLLFSVEALPEPWRDGFQKTSAWRKCGSGRKHCRASAALLIWAAGPAFPSRWYWSKKDFDFSGWMQHRRLLRHSNAICPARPSFVNPFYGRDCLIEPSMLENHYFDAFKKNRVSENRSLNSLSVPWSPQNSEAQLSQNACAGAHFLGSALRAQGHEVRLIPAQFVKPYRKSNKNDFIDAEAIAEAVTKQNMRFVQIKTQEQLDWQAMHRVRDRLMQRRTALINEIRGFLLERGLTFAARPI
jgi:hypothetical protein